MENGMEVSQKIQTRTTIWSRKPLLGIYPEKTVIRKHTCTPVFIAALFTVARTWKQPKYPSTEKWIKKIWYMVEYYLAIKKNEIMPFAATWIYLEIIILSEIQTLYGITYMWNLKKGYKGTYLKNRYKLTDLENQLMFTKGDRWEGGMNCRFGTGIYTLWYMEWLASGDLMYSTTFCDNLCGKRIWKRMDMCICTPESLCCTAEIITTL